MYSLAKGLIGVAFLVLVCLWAQPARAQDTSVPAELTKILRGFRNADWNEREAALQFLERYITDLAPADSFKDGSQLAAVLALKPELRQPVADAVVALLRTETTAMRTAGVGSNSEAYTEHLAALLSISARIHDVRAIPDLIEHLGRGAVAVDGVAAFGSAALPRVLKVAADQNEFKRSSSMLVLSAMLEPKAAAAVEAGDRSMVKDALMRGAADQSRWVRQASIQGLTKIPGDDVTGLLAKIAESDPFVMSNSGQAPVYPVRRAAAEALRKRG